MNQIHCSPKEIRLVFRPQKERQVRLEIRAGRIEILGRALVQVGDVLVKDGSDVVW